MLKEQVLSLVENYPNNYQQVMKDLKNMGDSAIPYLLPLLENTTKETRLSCAEILKNLLIDTPEVFDALRQRLEKENDDDVQYQIQNAIDALEQNFVEEGATNIKKTQTLKKALKTDNIIDVTKSLSWLMSSMGLIMVILAVSLLFLFGEKELVSVFGYTIFGFLNIIAAKSFKNVKDIKGESIEDLTSGLFIIKIMYLLIFIPTIIVFIMIAVRYIWHGLGL